MLSFGLSVTLLAATTCCTPPHNGEPLDRAKLVRVFDEEFDRPPSFWNVQQNPTGRWKTNYYFSFQETNDPRGGWESRTLVPNKETEYYGDPYEKMGSFEWKNGVLDIIGRRNPYIDDPRTNHLPFLSGLITTEKSFSQATGYWEARIAIPSGKGIWPAFWLLPDPKIVNGWAQPTGMQEIDVFESIGEPGKLYFTIFDDGDKKVGDQTKLQTNTDLSQFHTYGVLVTPTQITWYFDDKEVRRRENKDFKRPAYMLLNLAVGGEWPGVPDATTPLPARMRIDWVRAYKFK